MLQWSVYIFIYLFSQRYPNTSSSPEQRQLHEIQWHSLQQDVARSAGVHTQLWKNWKHREKSEGCIHRYSKIQKSEPALPSLRETAALSLPVPQLWHDLFGTEGATNLLRRLRVRAYEDLCQGSQDRPDPKTRNRIVSSVCVSAPEGNRKGKELYKPRN